MQSDADTVMAIIGATILIGALGVGAGIAWFLIAVL
jgi:hypothetical protein